MKKSFNKNIVSNNKDMFVNYQLNYFFPFENIKLRPEFHWECDPYDAENGHGYVYLVGDRVTLNKVKEVIERCVKEVFPFYYESYFNAHIDGAYYFTKVEFKGDDLYFSLYCNPHTNVILQPLLKKYPTLKAYYYDNTCDGLNANLSSGAEIYFPYQIEAVVNFKTYNSVIYSSQTFDELCKLLSEDLNLEIKTLSDFEDVNKRQDECVFIYRYGYKPSYDNISIKMQIAAYTHDSNIERYRIVLADAPDIIYTDNNGAGFSDATEAYEFLMNRASTLEQYKDERTEYLDRMYHDILRYEQECLDYASKNQNVSTTENTLTDNI